MTESTKITVSTLVNLPPGTVWEIWNGPEHIMQWNAASDDWHTPRAEVDLCVGGRFTSRMEARDGSAGFDFTGIYVNVVANERIEYEMEDGRMVRVDFEQCPEGTRVTETFDADKEHSSEMQRAGWQSILDNFRKYAESTVRR